MNPRRFLQQLRKELPVWESRGWLTRDASQAILQDVLQRQSARSFPQVLALLGAVLSGVGLISYVAAHWDGFGRLTRIGILAAALYLSYIAGGVLAALRGYSRKFAEAGFLLGVFAFGASIMLLAQMYNIPVHAPSTAMFLWILGGLATVYLLPARSALSVTLVLSLIWTSMVSFHVLPRPHFSYLPLWCAFLPVIYRRRWVPELGEALLCLTIWSVILCFAIPGTWHRDAEVYLVQLYFFAYSSWLGIGFLLRDHARFACFATPFIWCGAVGTLGSLYFLSSPYFQGDKVSASWPWAGMTVWAFLLWCALLLYLWMEKGKPRVSGVSYWGFGWIGFAVVLISCNLFTADSVWLPILFNLSFFGVAVWLLLVDWQEAERKWSWIASVFFGLGLATRYFEHFWSLQGRALFFTAGGLLLILYAWFLHACNRRVRARGQTPS